MGRPRKPGNKDLTLQVYCYPGRHCYVKHPLTGKQATLKTRDRKEARRIAAQLYIKWEGAIVEARAEDVTNRLNEIAVPGEPLTFSEYAERYRVDKLPTARKKKTGKPLSDGTREDYDRMLRNDVVPSEEFKLPLSAFAGDEGLLTLRRFLSRWLTFPNTYNYQKALLARVFDEAVAEGLLLRNPMSAISRRAVAKREVYVSDEDYAAITGQMADWEARACDLVYLVSHHPCDVLSLTESHVVGSTLKFTNTKTAVDMEIEMNEDLAEALQWFREWKTAQRIVSPYFVVYPRSSHKRYIGKPVSVGYLSRRFAEAQVLAKLPKGAYQLRDMRPKGLTDEFMIAGDSDKGGHLTEQMKRHYRRIKVPKRARSNIRRIVPKTS